MGTSDNDWAWLISDQYRCLRQAELRRRRSMRLALARQNGTHTEAEWEALKAQFFDMCVCCGSSAYRVEKDHIIPLSWEGESSDSIDNIQPLCYRCNARKRMNNTNYRATFFERFSLEPTLA